MDYSFKQGEDLLLQIQVFDKTNTKVSLTGADYIRVGLEMAQSVFKKYQGIDLEPPIANYGAATINVLDDTIIDIIIFREDSKLFPTGTTLTAHTLVQFPDTLLEGQAIEYRVSLGEITKGYLKDETLL